MDTLETSTERALADGRARRRSSDPRAVRRRRARPRLHAARGARRPRASSGCAVVEIEEALVGWMRDGTDPARPGAARRRAARRRRRRHRGGAGRGRPRRRTTWCCSTSTTAPATWSTSDNAALYERDVPRRACATALRPGGRWWSGRPTSRPTWPRRMRGGVRRRRRPIPYDVRCCRAATSSTGSTWRVPVPPHELAPGSVDGHGRLPHRARQHGRGPRSREDALWRAQTQRAVENFPISGTTARGRARPGAGAGQGAPPRRSTPSSACSPPSRPTAIRDAAAADRRRRARRRSSRSTSSRPARAPLEHEHERGARLARRRAPGSTSTPTTTSTPASPATTPSRPSIHVAATLGDRRATWCPALDHLATALEAQGRASSPTS